MAAAKKLLIVGVATVVGVILLELGAAQLYARVRHRPFARAEVAARLHAGDAPEADVPRDPAVANDPRVADQRVVIHPYFGYVVDPSAPRINPWGFFGRHPLATRGPDVALVAVFGGSVADQLVKVGGDALREVLAARGPFAGRRIELINLALGGYKQPQQVLVLTTLLALGAQFDAVINLDGFNEIDGAKDNLQDGVNPFFPYTWKLHARQTLDPAALTHVASADAIRSRREALRRRFAAWPVQHSVFLLTLWDFLDQRQDAALRAETAALRAALSHGEAGPQQTGPPVLFANEEAMYREAAEVWARASLEMSLLCDGYGIQYVHFLQPNQYLPGSKALTPEELAVAYDPDVADTQRVATAYPILSERGCDLRNQGVDFVDLSLLFRDETRSVYSDTCCHLNELGNRQLAEAIGESLVDGAGG